MTHPKYSVWDDFFGDSVYKPTMTRGLFIDHWTGWGPNPKYGAAVAANTQPENMGCSKQTHICTDDFLMKFWMMIWIRKWETYTPSYSGCSGILWQAQHAHHHLRRMVWKHMLFFLIHESVGKEFVWSPRGHVSCWSSHKLDVDTYII